MLVSWTVFLYEASDGMKHFHHSPSPRWKAFFKSWWVPRNHWVNFSKTYSLSVYHVLGGGFKYLLFSPLPGDDVHFGEYLSDGLKPPTSVPIQPVT